MNIGQLLSGGHETRATAPSGSVINPSPSSPPRHVPPPRPIRSGALSPPPPLFPRPCFSSPTPIESPLASFILQVLKPTPAYHAVPVGHHCQSCSLSKRSRNAPPPHAPLHLQAGRGKEKRPDERTNAKRSATIYQARAAPRSVAAQQQQQQQQRRKIKSFLSVVHYFSWQKRNWSSPRIILF